MKKYIIIIFLLPIFCSAQDKSQLEFTSVSVPLSAYFGTSGVGGSIGGELGLAYEKNLFLFSAYFGEGISFFETKDDSFSEFSLAWGRALPFNDWLQLEGFVGASYFYFKNRNIAFEGDETDATIGFPISGRLKFSLSDHFALGTQVRVTINSVQTITNIGSYIQIDF